jgi:hypothetical protein
MDTRESFSSLIYAEQEHRAEQELSEFICAVMQTFGAEFAGLSEQDWLDESDLMGSPPVSIKRNWHAVTIAASARLANRMSASLNQKLSAKTG